MYLRNILFNNEMLQTIDHRYADSSTAWSRWLEWMDANSRGIDRPDYSYLKGRFHSFNQFASLVGMIRGSAVESDSNKRWSSRFVFPFGADAIYEDLNVTPGGAVSREYINFGRTGELLYLMLCRSERVSELKPLFADIFERKNSWNQLVALFQPEDKGYLQDRGDSYLPYRSHPSFDRLAEDWLKVFRLGLPGFDAFQYLVTLGSLHVLIYQLGVAAEWSGQERPVFVCEVVAPKKTLVREHSILSFQRNNQLPQRAVDRLIRGIEESEEWALASAGHGAFVNCRKLLFDRVRWPRTKESGESDYEGPPESQQLIADLRRAAMSRHRQHVANVHRNYGRDVGLVSRRGTNTLRYAPTDPLLKALVLANVEDRMEYKDFLRRLYGRYGLVLGDAEAQSELDREEFDQKAFRANAQRLEQRLASLGVLKRLSDACTYVQNPFVRRSL
jgi:hypothetical protein